MRFCAALPVPGHTRGHAGGASSTRTAAAAARPARPTPRERQPFLTFAGALAYRRGIKHIVTGVCETDYSGYPDCRDDTIKALQVALNLGMDCRRVLHTPLMFIDKANTWKLADALGGEPLVQIILEHSHSCYVGDRSTRHAYGFGCDQCPVCELRRSGWERWVQVQPECK